MDGVKMKKSSDLNENVRKSDEQKWRWKPWPIVRSDYQRIALEADRSGDCDKAILYDSLSLSCGFIDTLLNNDQRSVASHETNSNEIKRVNSLSSNDVQQDKRKLSYLSTCLDAVIIGESNNTVKMQLNELRSKCAQLPTEWSVVQFNQIYSGYNGFATTKDVYTSDAPIKITLFCDSLSKQRDHRPISIVLDFIEFGEKSVSFVMTEIHNQS